MRTQTARSRSNEWYHPVPALRADRAKLGADLCTPTLRVQPSPVAEEGIFSEFDGVYDEERY
ncbi:hypothetical protein FRC08_009870 [Ceratobasidium sp. 394]|nr:hypothetical protein FRC08_009870 [Ceratobasidium sp. 394]